MKTFLNILKEICAVCIFLTPLIGFLYVRKKAWSRQIKWTVGIIITGSLAIILYVAVVLLYFHIGLNY